MNNFQKPHLLLLIAIGLLVSSCLQSCSDAQKAKGYRIGFSQCTGSDNWRKTMLQAMQRELLFHPGSEIIYKDAQDNSELQVQQINELLKENIDILLVSPNEAQPLTPIVEEVFTKGIPVVVIDRKTASSLYTSFIGGDNYEIGKLAATYVVKTLNGKGNVVEVIGLPGSTPAIERQKGFAEGLRNYPGIHIISEMYGNWQKDKASMQVEKNIAKLSQADLVFAHNDLMALGAYEIYKKHQLKNPVKFLGVDGLPGAGAGIEFVSNKILDATLLYPTGGEDAIQTAIKILNKEPFEKENILQTLVIDSSNVRLMKLQTDKINSQQKDIERQNEMLNEQVKIYNNQKALLNATVVALALIFVLGGFSFYSWRNNRKTSRRLAAQNDEILSQKNQLIEMSAIAQEANEAKLNFFTNISHEFRTPLSLILGPLESILKNPKLALSVKQNLEFVNKNVLRLLRLVNQLMDFRKIEYGKMKLRATENDLGEFVREITDAFRGLAQKKYISFNLALQERDIRVWFDVQMLDKVLFNLLSNAYKFTNEHGYINITVSRNLQTQMAIIKIEDSGIGMTPDTVEHAFDLFYQSDEASLKGSGIGLALSKQLISLHKGTISLKSEKWKGSIFEIQLPLGKSHLSPEEIVDKQQSEPINYEDVRIYSVDAEPIVPETDFQLNDKLMSTPKEHSILIIEDNNDMRAFLRLHLQKSYEIHEAENGVLGQNMAFDIVPDLIICDIILPGSSGLTITEKLKNDIRTSHIPIIILTAKIEIENQIESLRLKADAFITKPFNIQFLEETINSLLRNRESLKEHYTSELPTEIRTGVSKKIDRKFINEFAAIVENNISNENFSVEHICREIGISRVQLYRKLKALLGVHVNDYILNVRLQKAKYLLSQEDLTIAEVAFKVGFSSQAYFSTVFKSKFSCTPSVYKEKFKNANM
ncbi:MAG TPA: substrate-binding domain-containing protein [Flavisolibacter sp.]|nr:substrate-binding domain-containing protein [Flavisolibacter sp.]